MGKIYRLHGSFANNLIKRGKAEEVTSKIEPKKKKVIETKEEKHAHCRDKSKLFQSINYRLLSAEYSVEDLKYIIENDTRVTAKRLAQAELDQKMRIQQFRSANNVRYFAQRMMDKFSLVPFTDESEPVILYGMYKDEDYELLQKTKGTVIWCGTDAMVVNQKRADIIKAYPHRHIAKSKQVQNSLRNVEN